MRQSKPPAPAHLAKTQLESNGLLHTPSNPLRTTLTKAHIGSLGHFGSIQSGFGGKCRK